MCKEDNNRGESPEKEQIVEESLAIKLPHFIKSIYLYVKKLHRLQRGKGQIEPQLGTS